MQILRKSAIHTEMRCGCGERDIYIEKEREREGERGREK